jgi:general secretion pathway protein G
MMPSAAEHGTPERAGRRRADCGFTLVELLVVLVILGLVIGLAAPQVMKYLGGAKTDSAGLQIGRLSGTIDLYRLDVGSYPDQSVGLQALLEAPGDVKNWNGPYLKKADGIIDPWGRPYLYRFPGEHGEFDLYTLGSDGQEGGEGEDEDVTSW